MSDSACCASQASIMIPFMDYVAHEFGTATDWNYDNSYSFLTATSDAILSFQTPSTISLDVSSLSTANFATSYSLSTLGQLNGSISYLYTTIPLGHIPSASTSIPLKRLTYGYRDVPLPIKLGDADDAVVTLAGGRKPTFMHATLALPLPSTLTALYTRRLDRKTLLSVSLNSKTPTAPGPSAGPPPASVLAHVQHDTGRFSVEALGSTDSGLLGARGLWNFGIGPSAIVSSDAAQQHDLTLLGGSPDVPITPDLVNSLSPYHVRLSSKPSLLSAGAEFYYSPFSHVIGLSTGLRFTTLASHIQPSEFPKHEKHSSKPLSGTSALLSSALLAPPNITHSSFPYTMTLTMNPIIGSLASTYSVKPTPNLALSSRFDFNVYSWESQYVLGAEIWRKRRRRPSNSLVDAEGHVLDPDPTAWARDLTVDWFTPAERALKEQRTEREEENVVKLRIDDGWNVSALWTARVQALLVSAGFSVSPVGSGLGRVRGRNSAMGVMDDEGRRKRWTGTVGLSIAYSS